MKSKLHVQVYLSILQVSQCVNSSPSLYVKLVTIVLESSKGASCFIGGLLSDTANKKMGKLRGRYLVQLGNLGLEGVLIIIFPFVKNLGVSAFIFISASMFATWAVGSTSALVPYVDREVVGSVAGIIGFCGGLGGHTAVFFRCAALSGGSMIGCLGVVRCGGVVEAFGRGRSGIYS